MKLQDSITVTQLPPPANGNLFGVNSLQTTEYAEEYRITGRAQIDGAYFITPPIADPESSLNVEITVYDGNSQPQTLLHSETFHPVYHEQVLADRESFISFSQPVNVSDAFYIGYKINAPANSAFAAYNLPQGQTARNTAWINNKGKWIRATSHPLLPFATSLFIDPVIHYTNDSSNDAAQQSGVRIWIDARRNKIHILLPYTGNSTCKLYSTTGQLLRETVISGSEATIPVAGLHPGIYIIHIQSDNSLHTRKLFL
jgi:hypothetical protein